MSQEETRPLASVCCIEDVYAPLQKAARSESDPYFSPHAPPLQARTTRLRIAVIRLPFRPGYK